MHIQHDLWFVVHQQEPESINEPVWVLKSTSLTREEAEADYLGLDRKHKMLLEWSILGGIKIFMADFNQTENIDWEQVSYLAIPSGSDFCWDVAIAVNEYYKNGFLFKS